MTITHGTLSGVMLQAQQILVVTMIMLLILLY